MAVPDLATERVLKAGEADAVMSRYVPALHDAASLWVPDSVGFVVLPFAAHLPFPGHGVELPEVLDVYKGSGPEDEKMRDVGFLAVKHIEWRLHLERLVQSPVLEVRSCHELLPPYGRWNAAVCEHVPNHGARSPPNAFGHIDLLRRVGGGKLLDNTGLQAVLPKLLPGVLATLVGAPKNDAATEGDDRRADKQLNQLKSLILVGQKVDGGPLGVLDSHFADVFIAAYGHWCEGLHQILVAQLERPTDFKLDYF